MEKKLSQVTLDDASWGMLPCEQWAMRGINNKDIGELGSYNYEIVRHFGIMYRKNYWVRIFIIGRVFKWRNAIIRAMRKVKYMEIHPLISCTHGNMALRVLNLFNNMQTWEKSTYWNVLLYFEYWQTWGWLKVDMVDKKKIDDLPKLIPR